MRMMEVGGRTNSLAIEVGDRWLQKDRWSWVYKKASASMSQTIFLEASPTSALSTIILYSNQQFLLCTSWSDSLTKMPIGGGFEQNKNVK